MIEIIPAIDLIDGKCVRLQKGDYQQKTVYNDSPLDVAKQFEDVGIKRLHLVDLDGAKAHHVVNLPVLEKIASNTTLTIDFGGGIKSNTDIFRVFNAGASMATIGSVAVKNKELFISWLKKYGPEKIILGADVLGGKIAISGWYDVTELSLVDFVDYFVKMGIRKVLCTDISKDGMLAGTSTGLYQELQEKFPGLQIIASGGLADISEVDQLNQLDIFGVIIGKAIYEGRIQLDELKPYLNP
jgi:phosphoribosylformimino-5-aminoimidazole carboxamide ribotide isomerase